jgi:acetoin utilization protein AcuC
MLPNFFYHPRMLTYDFGPRHPLKPERLRRTIELVKAMTGIECIDPGPGTPNDALRVHPNLFAEAVERASRPGAPVELEYGLGTGDTPIFEGMFEASLAYLAGTVRAAERVRDGASLAFNIAGGLHHARKAMAHGFCVFNDPAAAIDVLLERCDRVGYVDIDVHHGDGVQWIWYDDPRVLTYSIHENPRTLYPGTGFVDETGEQFTSLNVPLERGTTADVWLWAFESTIKPAFERFRPQAIVLQLGTDSHALDPLAHLQNSVQSWVQAVSIVRDFGVPIVAVGGGGYNLNCVPRMWTAAMLTLANIEFENAIPEPLASDWNMPTFFDDLTALGTHQGRSFAQAHVEWLLESHIPNIIAPTSQ